MSANPGLAPSLRRGKTDKVVWVGHRPRRRPTWRLVLLLVGAWTLVDVGLVWLGWG